MPSSRLFRLFVLLWLTAVCALPLQVLARPAAVVPAGPAPQAACDWNAPGHNPFMGDVVAAVDAYQDIPAATRARLRQRMAARAYDEVVRIRRDSIEGRRSYRSDIRDMHFGSGQRCATVDRSRWTAQAEERGLVYCEDGHCVLVPTVCRNVSRIRLADGAAGQGGGASAATGAGAAPDQQAAGDPATSTSFAEAAAPPEALPLSPSLSLSESESAETAALPLSQVAAEPAVSADGRWPGRLGTPGAVPLSGPGFVDNWVPGQGLAAGLPRSPITLPVAPAPPVPEPATLLLMLGGLLLLATCRRRFSPA